MIAPIEREQLTRGNIEIDAALQKAHPEVMPLTKMISVKQPGSLSHPNFRIPQFS